MKTLNAWGTALCGLLLAGCTNLPMPNFNEIPTLFSLLPNSELDIVEPSNAPPEGYRGEFWVDARGCEFMRTSSGQWVPRFGNNGRAVCHEDLQGISAETPSPETAERTGPEPGAVVAVDPATGTVTRIAAQRRIPTSYVNVATFSRTENGVAARKAFADMGFPIVGADQRPAPGRAVSVVLGPFTVQDALDDALEVARSLGYREATTFSN